MRKGLELLRESLQESKEMIFEFIAAGLIGCVITLLFLLTKYFVAFPILLATMVIAYAYRKRNVELLQSVKNQARISFSSFYIILMFAGMFLSSPLTEKDAFFLLLFPLEFLFIFWIASFLRLKLLKGE